MIDFRWLRSLWLGQRVLGVPVYKTAALAAGTAVLTPLFTVAGGRVRLTNFYGRVNVAPAVGVGTILLRLRLTPTVVGAVTDMNVNSADVVGLAQYSLLTYDGVVTNALIITAGATGVQALHSFVANQQSLEPGVIGVLQTVGTPPVTAGNISWTLLYAPLDPGATVTAA